LGFVVPSNADRRCQSAEAQAACAQDRAATASDPARSITGHSQKMRLTPCAPTTKTGRTWIKRAHMMRKKAARALMAKGKAASICALNPHMRPLFVRALMRAERALMVPVMGRPPPALRPRSPPTASRSRTDPRTVARWNRAKSPAGLRSEKSGIRLSRLGRMTRLMILSPKLCWSG
jgi:hypothetical protein